MLSCGCWRMPVLVKVQQRICPGGQASGAATAPPLLGLAKPTIMQNAGRLVAAAPVRPDQLPHAHNAKADPQIHLTYCLLAWNVQLLSTACLATMRPPRFCRPSHPFFRLSDTFKA